MLNTGFRIANRECHRNYVLISKEKQWRSPAEKPEEEMEQQDYRADRKGKTETYSDKPSLWLKKNDT